MHHDGESVVTVHFCEECEHQIPVGFAEWRAEASDTSSPRDADASCDRCGARGTVARVKRVSAAIRVTGFCRLCWPVVRVELSTEEEERRIRRKEEFWTRVRAGDRRHGTPEQRPERVSWSSRSWDDTRELLALLSQTAADPQYGAACAEMARAIQASAGDMDGPMPADIERFVQQHRETAV